MRRTKSRRQKDLLQESMCSWVRRQPPLAPACPRWGDDGRAGSKETEVRAEENEEPRRPKGENKEKDEKKEEVEPKYVRI